MYLLQINRIVPIGRTTGVVNRYVEHYEAESLKPLLFKCSKILTTASSDVTINVSFYKLERLYVTEIMEKSFNFEKLENLSPLLYFHTYGQRIEVEVEEN